MEFTFLKGLEFEEIEDLLEVMHTCFKSPDSEEDLVTLLWEKDLNHVKYLVVDDLLDVDVPSAEDVPDDAEVGIGHEQGHAHVAQGLHDVLLVELADAGELLPGVREALGQGLEHGGGG